MNETPPHLCRIIFNFTRKCNLSCQFCYIPFGGIDSDLQLWQRIVDQCKVWEPRNLTFGGGDPFMYKDFPSLLESTESKELFIQVDTNALALHDRYVPIIKQSVNLLGLPIEGTESVHTIMRSHPTHFKVVTKWLQKLVNEGVSVKINTVVSKININDLDRLAQLLKNFPIQIWSLYQFWPLALGNDNQQIFEISKQEFLNVTNNLKEKYDFTRIEVSAVSNRLYSYFFVSHTGLVYVVDRHNYNKYIALGSVFDKDILVKWQEHGDYEAVGTRANLRINM